jgi:anti-anti-sigma factor
MTIVGRVGVRLLDTSDRSTTVVPSPMITLKCLNCGLTIPYQGSEGDHCPRCMSRAGQAVRLIQVSDRVAPGSRASMGRLSIHSFERESRHTIVLEGELDMGSAPLLESALSEACDGAATDLVVDMSRVEFIDSSGLKAILHGKTLCERRHSSFSLTPATRPAQRVFEATGLVDRLRFRRVPRAKGATGPELASG